MNKTLQFQTYLTFICSLIFAGVGCANSPKNVEQSDMNPRTGKEASAPLRIIDAHIHTHFTGKKSQDSGIIDSKESLIKEMKENGVVGAVAHTKQDLSDYINLKNENIIHCAGVQKKVDVKKVESGLKDGRFSCIKIYLGYVYQYASSENYTPVYQLAMKYNVPVVLHTGDTYDMDGLLKYSDPLTVDEIAVRFRKVKFVIAHMGNPWIQSAAEVIYKNENVYGDLSALLIGDLSTYDPNDLEEYIIKPIRWAFGYVENPRKLMFGTDWNLTDMKSYIAAVKKAVPPEHWNDVFYNNAQRVFKIPGLPVPE